jgi:hypothetical protein
LPALLSWRWPKQQQERQPLAVDVASVRHTSNLQRTSWHHLCNSIGWVGGWGRGKCAPGAAAYSRGMGAGGCAYSLCLISVEQGAQQQQQQQDKYGVAAELAMQLTVSLCSTCF